MTSKNTIHIDAFLVSRLKKSDENAFHELYDKYWNRIYWYAYSFLKNSEDAQEVAQDVFVKIWLKRATLNPNLSFVSFLYTITKNQCLNAISKMANDGKLLSEVYLKGCVSNSSADELIREGDCKQINQELLERLPPSRRKIFEMSRIEGKSHKDIAAELGISIQTVKNQINRALSYFATHYIHVKEVISIFACFFVIS